MWDILHGKMRMLNKIIRNLYFELDKRNLEDLMKELTAVIKEHDSTFDCYPGWNGRLKIHNLRGQ